MSVMSRDCYVRWTEISGALQEGEGCLSIVPGAGQIGSYSVLPLGHQLVGNIWEESIWSQTGSIDWLLRYGHYNIPAKVAFISLYPSDPKALIDKPSLVSLLIT